MLSIRLPRVRLLTTTNLSQDYHHSILISLLRGLAAIEIVAAHLRAQLFPSLRAIPDPTIWYQALAFFTGFAHQAVVVFFLLSGWLVGGSLLNKLHEPGIMVSYAIDRLTRLWVVLVPAFVLSLLIAAYTDAVDPNQVSYSRENEYSVTSFIGNLFGLQDMAVPRFAGNFSLWSLANETWYYVLFPLLLLPFIGKTMLTRGAAAVTCMCVAYLLMFQIVLYFAIWLLGVAFSRISIDVCRSQRLILVTLLAGISVFFRLTGSNDILVPASFVQDFVFSIAFLLLLSSLQFRADAAHVGTRLASMLGKHLAPFSFSLYVIHVPLLRMLHYMHEPLFSGGLMPHKLGAFVVYAAMLVSIVFFAFLFHLPFEAQTYRIRGWVKRVIFRWRARRAGVALASALKP